MIAIETKARPPRVSTSEEFPGIKLQPPQSDAVSLPPLLTLIVVTLFIPIELSFYVFGLRLTVIRFIFLVTAPFLCLKFMRKVSSGQYRFVFSDLFIGLTAFWMIYAPANIDGIEPALNHAGPEVLELFIAYLAARTLLTQPGQAVKLAALLCKTIAVVAFIGLLDPLTDHYFIRDLARQITGYSAYLIDWTDTHRLGLMRASGPVEHPIAFGFTCAIGLLMSASMEMKGRWLIMTACALGAVFSLSSAPVHSLILGTALLQYGRLASGIPTRWTILFVLGAAGIFATFLISSNPLGFLISNLIFDPMSGYYRYWTWETVLAHVADSRWYGLGYGELPYEMPTSIDAFWLVQAVHGGYPGAILTFLSLVGASSISTSGKGAKLTPQEVKLGTILGIVVFLTVFDALTVHLWGAVYILTFLLAGTRAHLGELGRLSISKQSTAVASQGLLPVHDQRRKPFSKLDFQASARLD